MDGNTLLLGTGWLPIDPPFGTELSGFIARRGGSLGSHDPLCAQALAVSDGREKLALVAADLIGVDGDLLAEVRSLVGEWTDIPPERVIISATHTHSGPAVLRRAYLGKADPAYLAGLARNLAGAAALANRSLEPVRVYAGHGECRVVGHNRRHPGGPTDPELFVLRFAGPSKTKALLVNYACHPVVLGPGNHLTSADYPAYIRAILASLYPGALILFTNGAAGDINTGHHPRASVTDPDGPRRTFAEAERLGRILAGTALAVAEAAPEVAGGRLAFAAKRLELPLEPVPGRVEWLAEAARLEERARELAESGAGYGEIREAEVLALRARDLAAAGENGRLCQTAVAEIAAFSLGGIAFATLPGEFFHELGLAIKGARAPGRVCVLGYTGATLGYVATSAAYDEGGYEVEDSYKFYGLPARLARGAGEKVAQAVIELLESL